MRGELLNRRQSSEPSRRCRLAEEPPLQPGKRKDVSMAKKHIEIRQQTFSLTAPGAVSVTLVGEFTHWQEKPIPRRDRVACGTLTWVCRPARILTVSSWTANGATIPIARCALRILSGAKTPCARSLDWLDGESRMREENGCDTGIRARKTGTENGKLTRRGFGENKS
jgi:hypothetical protein